MTVARGTHLQRARKIMQCVSGAVQGACIAYNMARGPELASKARKQIQYCIVLYHFLLLLEQLVHGIQKVAPYF
jgi:hypothetical protein